MGAPADAAWASCFVNIADPEEAESREREALVKIEWDTEEVEDSKHRLACRIDSCSHS